MTQYPFQNNLPVIKVVDTLVVLVLVPQILAFYWNGTWLLVELYVYPQDMEMSAWICYIVGNSMFILATLGQNILRKYFIPENGKRTLRLYFVHKLYIYILGLSAITQWRGIAYVAILYTGMSLTSALVGLFLAAVMLCFLRNYLGTIFPPLTFGLDPDVDDYFKIYTRFSIQPGFNLRFVLDTLFTVMVINTMIIFVLKGQWVVLEVLMPLKSETSAEYLYTGMMSLLIFYGLIVLPVVGQYELKRFSSKLNVKSRITLQELFLFVFGFLPMLFWRGVYYIHLSFLTEDYYIIYSWTAHVLGFIAINAMLTSGSMVPIGCVCDTDAFEFENGVFDHRYVKTFIDYRMKSRSRIDLNDSEEGKNLNPEIKNDEKDLDNSESIKLFKNELNTT